MGVRGPEVTIVFLVSHFHIHGLLSRVGLVWGGPTLLYLTNLFLDHPTFFYEVLKFGDGGLDSIEGGLFHSHPLLQLLTGLLVRRDIQGPGQSIQLIMELSPLISTFIQRG